MSKRVYRIVTFTFVLIFVFSSLKAISYFYHSYKSKNSYDEIKSIYGISEPITSNKTENFPTDTSSFADDLEILPQNKLDIKSSIKAKRDEAVQRLRELNFNKLQKINKDIISWIYIPNTKIDYPVVKGIDNEFYLHHDAVKSSSEVGAIFMDYRNVIKSNFKNSDKNIVLYGHNMKNGTMFKDLTKFGDITFFNENKYIYLDTSYGRHQWEIFSVFVAKSDFNYRQTKFESSNEYLKFLSTIKKKSLVPTNVELSANDQILTLSTCSYEFDNARFVVVARNLIN